MLDCVFCKIINRQIPSNVVAETEDIIVIEDIAPKATIHYLIIPKKHIKDLSSFKTDDFYLASEMFAVAQDLSKKQKNASQFRLVINNGPKAGQCIFHVHIHFLAGDSIPTFD